MPSRNKRLCVFGDSHFSSAKIAYDQGIIDHAGVDVEFWGNIGRVFRNLGWRNGQIEPLDDFTAGRFAKTNSAGRTALNTDDFDAILFIGCRIDVVRLFPEILHRRSTTSERLSSGVERRWITDFLHRMPPYQFARQMAAQQKAEIMLAPISFPTEGAPNPTGDFTESAQATRSDRDGVWDLIEDIMLEDGITLIQQPEATVTGGCSTKVEYAVKDHLERNDYAHKNPAYGALILQATLELLQSDVTLSMSA